ncbi:aminoglycoside adenylyltransferase domain-containing protein [Exiguobacterium sp. s141]|uniref:aminoglycoside adenylyltransferase domain-containing protein n=1 Tax=Exiguobacterium sp. s141 TaxID=2751240 RepID=UPI001BE9D155|nr:aminoglycoside adenylyltransferase domain-containing protein [Exiguobacterium sp. s141]
MSRGASSEMPAIIRPVVEAFIERVDGVLPSLEHLYLHGSAAMGGFHPDHSDLDFLIVTSRPLTLETKVGLTRLCLESSNEPYPIELSVLTVGDLTAWRHPSPFDFHYSEGWRSRFESALQTGEIATIQSGMTDPDLAAHIKITSERGIVLYGRPLKDVIIGFNEVDYRDAILFDARDCLDSIHDTPMYSVLNLTRVLAYCSDDLVLSKQEAFEWSTAKGFSTDVLPTIEKAAAAYAGNDVSFIADELNVFRDFARDHLQHI